MATIIERTSKSPKNFGKKSYRVQVNVRTTDGRRLRLSNTFERKASAQKWAKKLEDESDRTGVFLAPKDAPETICSLIEAYLRDMDVSDAPTPPSA